MNRDIEDRLYAWGEGSRERIDPGEPPEAFLRAARGARRTRAAARAGAALLVCALLAASAYVVFPRQGPGPTGAIVATAPTNNDDPRAHTPASSPTGLGAQATLIALHRANRGATLEELSLPALPGIVSGAGGPVLTSDDFARLASR